MTKNEIYRHNQVKILCEPEIQLLFSKGLQTKRDRALFGICLYGGCRINEVCTLTVRDVFTYTGKIKPDILIRKGKTESKLAARYIYVCENLKALLKVYQHPDNGYLFPGRHCRGHINPDSATRLLREACERVGLEGVSTETFRRTMLVQLCNSGYHLKEIQEISGHKTLTELRKHLEKYLVVNPKQIRGDADEWHLKRLGLD